MNAAPLIPADVDLRGLDYMPLFGNHLFGSEFNSAASDSEWRAAVTLWWAAWNQVPAGSLPDDDVALCRLADLGRDVKTWKKLRERALHGFIRCNDGRLYHEFLCGQAIVAWGKRQADRLTKANERDRKERERQRRSQMFQDLEKAGFTPAWNVSTTELTRLHTQYCHARSHAHVTVTGSVTGTAMTGKDGKGREDKSEEPSVCNSTSPQDEATDSHTQPPDLPNEIQLQAAFDRVRERYPAFAGRQDWLMAEHHWRLRIERDGVPVADLHAGVERYAAYCAGGGVSGARFVMTPVNFFSAADKPYGQPWLLPDNPSGGNHATKFDRIHSRL